MNIKDYLHLYLGCEATEGVITGVLTEASIDTFNRTCVISKDGMNYRLEAAIVKPILRPLSDMTEEEEFAWSEEGHKEADPMMAEAAATRYLLSKHFDLFNLIPAGLAIDKTTISNNVNI